MSRTITSEVECPECGAKFQHSVEAPTANEAVLLDKIARLQKEVRAAVEKLGEILNAP